jgi:cold shock protein
MQGTIKTIVVGKEFGFITADGREKDIFFHKNELKGVNFEDLKAGDQVSFDEEASEKGPKAVNVTLV